MTIEEQLASKVRARRGDMSLREAADEAGVNHCTIRRVEARELPNVRTLAKLIGWANIDAAKLFAAGE